MLFEENNEKNGLLGNSNVKGGRSIGFLRFQKLIWDWSTVDDLYVK